MFDTFNLPPEIRLFEILKMFYPQKLAEVTVYQNKGWWWVFKYLAPNLLMIGWCFILHSAFWIQGKIYTQSYFFESQFDTRKILYSDKGLFTIYVGGQNWSSAPLHSSPRWADHFFSIESSWKPKRTQTATEWRPFGFVLVFNSAFGNGRHWL